MSYIVTRLLVALALGVSFIFWLWVFWAFLSGDIPFSLSVWPNGC